MLLLLTLACTAPALDTSFECFEPTRTCWWDEDMDGFGVEPHTLCADPWQARPESCRLLDGDCDDADPTVYPGYGC